MTTQKKHNNILVIHYKEIVICELPEKKIKINTLKKFSEIQESTDGQLNEPRKTMHKQNRIFKKRVRNYKNIF